MAELNKVTLRPWKDAKGDPYIPSQALVDVVNLAIHLKRRPLLLRGEPGCGKTKLAEAVANELGVPFAMWSVKSTSKAKDGLYTFDAIRRLQDAQLARENNKHAADVANPENYVDYGELGQAILQNKPSVVLIDEIDKADLDFPNDLLLELDQTQFVIDEVLDTDANGQKHKRVVEAKPENRPLIFITSNDEKPLPPAFLRRCLFHFIPFPNDEEQFKQILLAHFVQQAKKDRRLKELIGTATKKFLALRKRMIEDKVQKKPSTSESIDWVNGMSQNSEESLALLMKNVMPFPQALLKNEDQEKYKQLMG